MAKRIKMVLYGEPGVGKSVFASKAPKPFFICTDGNYEWLDEFGVDPEAHLDVQSWTEAKQFLSKESNFEQYETIVLDLTEDLFKWCESEYCLRNRIEHLSDLAYGKAYDATRTEFFLTISKLIAMDKNVILIMHGVAYTEKDRRGVEHTKYGPSSRIPDKVVDMIEGRVRYFLRAYLKDEEHDEIVTKKRYLSIVPKPNEFGIARGIDESKVPQDIPLDWDEFTKIVGVNNAPVQRQVTSLNAATKSNVTADKKISDEVVEETKEAATAQTVEAKQEAEVKEELSTTDAQTVENSAQPTNDEKRAAIMAKLAALKEGK